MDGLLNLDGKVAFITGAGQGVGKETALTFARHGARAVIVNDFHEDRAQAVVDELAALGLPAMAAGGDVSDISQVNEMTRRAEAEFGPVDILVNNAGNAGAAMTIANLRRFWEAEPEEWNHWLGANLFGVLNCTRAVIAGMVQRRSGRVITVVSDAGRIGEPSLAVYSAAKAGAAGFMRALAKEVGHANVTANCVALGVTRTPGVKDIVVDEETEKRMLRSYVLRRIGEPADAAGMILFLASAAGSWITGQTYPVNGGYSFAV